MIEIPRALARRLRAVFRKSALAGLPRGQRLPLQVAAMPFVKNTYKR